MVFPFTELDSGEGSLVCVISGPTASGKSSLAVEIAEKSDGIIINADSLQLTSALPILTAHPSLESKRKIPHRLYGIYQPGTLFSAGMWLKEVLRVIEETLAQKKLPIVVGGTGLYIKALLEGLSPMPEVSLAIRQQVNELFEVEGREGLRAKLDAEVCAKYQDPQRLKRALEVFLSTGNSILDYQKIKPTPPKFNFYKIGIDVDRDVLKNRIQQRLKKMLDLGVLDEVKDYMETYDFQTPAIGYTELKSYLLREMTLEKALEWTEIKTCQYAKRQSTWFRNQMTYNQKLAITI